MNVRLSNFINLSRWLSAFLVVAGHTRGLLFVEYSLLENKSIIAHVLYFITGFGHQAVIVFFVLSGFLVGGKVLERVHKGAFNLKDYYVDRLTRLYTVVFLALIFGYVLDQAGSELLSGAGFYVQMPRTFGVKNPEQDLSLIIFLGNLLFLQSIFVPTLGTNGPLWSLANEFWYYLIFPFFVFAFSPSLLLVKRVTFGLVAAIMFLILPENIRIYFPIWMIGAVIYRLKKPFVSHYYIPLIMFILALLSTRMRILPDVIADYLLAIAFSLMLNTLSFAKSTDWMFYRFNKSMADFSFSLYVTHFPVLVFTVSMTTAQRYVTLKRLGVQNLLFYVAVIILIYGVSFVFSILTEKNTDKVRIQVNRLII